jgi:hypothetical protein
MGSMIHTDLAASLINKAFVSGDMNSEASVGKNDSVTLTSKPTCKNENIITSHQVPCSAELANVFNSADCDKKKKRITNIPRNTDTLNANWLLIETSALNSVINGIYFTTARDMYIETNIINIRSLPRDIPYTREDITKNRIINKSHDGCMSFNSINPSSMRLLLFINYIM